MIGKCKHGPRGRSAHFDQNSALARPLMCRTDLFCKYREDMETFDARVGNRADH
ncbi:hypothetical protein SAICODRAFT_29497 [Saitoella complicata NRRL Y-17804]|uniref:uncharacterized protein n=1 Tax=Saitoella complicata (strain BCRC 22490 / CBS 7301 / JCM 7358 / NBRC 10748 / NRRL Y-17804) TaxID=698492 RepID=UPI0008672FC6|nr:uncharacterized protein SAICODRAFT_29497 [Saitoella complicata NRRL Y-17804]ODQ54341.1 hypothetical protein SAICODRAFT_29497 [Saitoella complicata NRRL Y-17804]